MSEETFNLVDEGWIRVMRPDCTVEEVSLLQALTGAHNYISLAGEMEAQNVAMLRLLIAVTHTVFTRVDVDGEPDPVENEDMALERWKSLKELGRIPEQPVREYLKKWHERFWLVHPTHPFYQVPAAKQGTKNKAAKLNGEVSESNNKARLFSFLSNDGKQGMTTAEGARWLLFINGFDDCAAKQQDKNEDSRSMTIAWLGKLGIVTVVGRNLFETIMLNMNMLIGGKLWETDDEPVWELPEPCSEERRTIEMPKDLAGLFTLQSRRVLLQREGDSFTGYSILGGDAFDEKNALEEPMTLWRRFEEKKTKTEYFIPRRHERARQIWRDFGALVTTGEKERRPDVISWCEMLERKGLIDSDRLLTLCTTCVRYDSSQSSSITDSFSDTFSFNVDLLTDAGMTWIEAIKEQIGKIESAADKLGWLAADLSKACGQGDNEHKNDINRAKEQFYQSVDIPFRDWLLLLDAEQEADDRQRLLVDWQTQAGRIALGIGRQLVDEKGDIAFIGRDVSDKKKKTQHYSSPNAFRMFKNTLGKIYPYNSGATQQGTEPVAPTPTEKAD